MVKASGTVKAFPKTSLFSTAHQEVLFFFPRQLACFGYLKGWGGNFRKSDSEVSENKPKRVHGWLFFPVLKCWGMKPVAPTAGLAPVHVEQVGPQGHQASEWHKGCVLTASGAGAAPQSSDAAAGGPGCGAGRAQWTPVRVLPVWGTTGAAHPPF